MRGNLADLAATGLASEPTLRKWIAAQPDQAWIIKRGSNGDAYEIELEGAIEAFRAEEQAKTDAARDRAAQINQLALEFGISVPAAEQSVELSIAERKQLLEEELVAMRVARMRGELVSLASCQAAFGDVMVMFRQRLRTMSARLAKKIDLSRDQITAIDRHIELELGELATAMEKMEANLNGDRGAHRDDADPAAQMADPAIQNGV